MAFGKLGEAFVSIRAETRGFFSQLGNLRAKTQASLDSLGVDFTRLGSMIKNTFGGAVRTAFRGLSSLLTSLMAQIGQLTAMLGVLGAAGTVAFAVKMAANLESTKIAFETFTGSAQLAGQAIKDLREFSDFTPFKPDEVLAAGRALLQNKFAVDQLVPALKLFGPAAAAAQVDLKRLISVFGQVQGKGKVMTEEIQQFAEAGLVGLRAAVAKVRGESLPQLTKSLEEGRVSAQDLMDAFQELASTDFLGILAKDAQSLKGLFSTIIGRVRDLLGLLGTGLSQALNLKGIVADANIFLGALNKTIRQMTELKGEVNAAEASGKKMFQAFSGVLLALASTADTLENVLGKMDTWIQKASTVAKILADALSLTLTGGLTTPDFGGVAQGENVQRVNKFLEEIEKNLEEAAQAQEKFNEEMGKPERVLVPGAAEADSDRAAEEAKEKAKDLAQEIERLRRPLMTPFERVKAQLDRVSELMKQVKEGSKEHNSLIEVRKRLLQQISDLEGQAAEKAEREAKRQKDEAMRRKEKAESERRERLSFKRELALGLVSTDKVRDQMQKTLRISDQLARARDILNPEQRSRALEAIRQSAKLKLEPEIKQITFAGLTDFARNLQSAISPTQNKEEELLKKIEQHQRRMLESGIPLQDESFGLI